MEFLIVALLISAVCNFLLLRKNSDLVRSNDRLIDEINDLETSGD